MFNVNLAAVRGACIVLRSRLGGHIGGFPALIHALTGLGVFAALFAVIRGFLSGTLIGDFLAVPVAIPLIVLGGMLTVVWCVRAAGLLPEHGPLRSEAVEDGFTGDPAPWWTQRIPGISEWAAIERAEPALLTFLGLALLLWSSTRSIGLAILVAASALMIQARMDRESNRNDEFVSVIPPPPLNPDTIPDIDTQLSMLPEELFGILDADTRERLRPERKVGATVRAVRVTPHDRPQPTFMARPPDSVPIHGGPLTLMVRIAVLTALNFVIGDPVGLYHWMPERCRAAVFSLESELGSIGLVDTQTRYRLGTLSEPFLLRFDASWHADWHRQAMEHAIGDADGSLRLLEEHITVMEALAAQASGIVLQNDASSDEFDLVVLTVYSVAEAWADLLAYASEARKVLADGRTTIDITRATQASDSIDRVLAVHEYATSIAQRTESYIPQITHIGTMRDLVMVDHAQRLAHGQEFDG